MSDNYESVRADALDEIRAYLFKIEAWPRNTFASHADRVVPEIVGQLTRLWNAAEDGRAHDWRISTDQLSVAEVAEVLRVSPATVRTYVARGVMPQPDGHVGRSPWWRRATLTAWQASRPGQGKGGGRPHKNAEDL